MSEGSNWDESKLQDAKWVEIQKKTFTRWANTYLKERMLKVDDLETDLHDGILLINLLEVISSKSLGKFNKNPKIRSQKLENTQFALNFLKTEGIKLVNIGNEDIVDAKLKLILGLIWTIILRYQIHIEEGKSAKSDLLKWVQQQIPEYGITNFTNNWNDGKAICALANSLMPGILPNHRELDPNQALRNAELGEEVAETKLGIPKVLDPLDMINPNVDELSVMTYISYYRDWLNNQAKKRSLEEQERLSIPQKCRAYGPGLEKGETYIPTEFTIEAINTFNRRVNHGGDPFEVSIMSPKQTQVPFRMQDNENGLYNVFYTPTDVGRHVVTIRLTGHNISGSPYNVPVTRTVADSKYCKAFGPGLEGAIVDEDAPFTIAAYNRLGEPIKDGGDKFDVKVKGPYEDVPVDYKDNNDGTYTVKYKPNDTGDHVVSVQLRGDHLPNSPFTVPVALSLNAPDPFNCIAYGPGLQGGNTSEPGIFTIEVRNREGKKLSIGGVPIDVDIADSEGSEVAFKLLDNRDGTFTATYQPVEPGIHTVDVILRHKQFPLFYNHIKESPFKVPIEAGADAIKSIAFGPGLEDGNDDQHDTTFTIQAKDRNGNNMDKGGDPFDVKIHGPNGPVDAKIKDNDDGTYTVDYKPNDAGKHRVDVTLKGQPINKSPYTVMIKEGADDQTSIIESYSFVIQAKSKKGQNLKKGGDKFKVTISGPSGNVPVDLKDLGTGQYLVTYKLPGPGKYVIHVTVDDKPLKGYENGLIVNY